MSPSIRYLRQSISITGLGSQAFEAVCSALPKVHARFSHYIPAGKLQPLTAIERYRDSLTIEMSNCYLSTRRKDHNEVHIPFTKDIDPKGALSRAVGNQYICSKQNVIQYCKWLHTKEGTVQ